MATLSQAPRVRPLHVRPGARYACFGDGLCCTDVHGLGPLTRREVRALRVIRADAVATPSESGFDDPMLRTTDEGACVFLGASRCELHAAHGAEAKPDGCRRFPLSLTATPRGGRVTTRHRCPCRSMGERPALTAEAAEPSLLDPAGRLQAEHRVPGRVSLRPGQRVGFADYERIERALFARLAGGERPARVLGVDPFPELGEGRSWVDAAEEMLAEGEEPTRFGAALGWFAESIRAQHVRGHRRVFVERPWASGFDRAEERARELRAPSEMIADWIADSLWAMTWTEHDGSLARARADLSTRLAIVEDLRSRLGRHHLRDDRATAEAIMIVDLVGDSEWWTDLRRSFRAARVTDDPSERHAQLPIGDGPAGG